MQSEMSVTVEKIPLTPTEYVGTSIELSARAPEAEA